MKKVLLLIATVTLMASCNSSKSVTSSVMEYSGTAATLLSTLNPDSKLADIATLFSLLDTNEDESISKVEAIGEVAENFNILDSDEDNGIDLQELSGLLSLLK